MKAELAPTGMSRRTALVYSSEAGSVVAKKAQSKPIAARSSAITPSARLVVSPATEHSRLNALRGRTFVVIGGNLGCGQRPT
jgi:hypothetical protein